MDEIKQFKDNSNGAYVKYNVKDLVAGLHVKMDNHQKEIKKSLDKINERLESGSKKIAKLETNVSWLNKLIISLYALIGTLLISPVKKLFEWLIG